MVWETALARSECSVIVLVLLLNLLVDQLMMMFGVASWVVCCIGVFDVVTAVTQNRTWSNPILRGSVDHIERRKMSDN
jgi:hypothetical protein